MLKKITNTLMGLITVAALVLMIFLLLQGLGAEAVRQGMR